ncbi:hypothetical protein N0V93_005125 [Gnomoniopsis smithogilvyi]|uniref:Uncharacterized protein n=1 Tax=Gnomoniopsis smithogilvyi TaxID=1191159 RepID=A0A9W8YSB8_9PEZI|nr:hypothetical protein N0V93_005125 [Gnomoniopsis smithogilvyi]
MSTNNVAVADSSPSATDLWSAIGTWVAVLLALIALLGIVAPYVALKSALSDYNRAMNSVRDVPGTYIGSGIPIRRGYRAFRRIRVPNLAPGYIANVHETPPLLSYNIAAANTRLIFRKTNYSNWNTGWAKLSQLLEAYRSTGTIQSALQTSHQGGSLEVVQGRTAVVVDKHWLLILGLLGRYSAREDRGILYRRGIRRDLGGERFSTAGDMSSSGHEYDSVSDGEYSEGDENYNPRLYRGRYSSGLRRSYRRLGRRLETLHLHQDGLETWKLSHDQQPAIYGVTGELKSIGRKKGTWSNLSAVTFTPHTMREIFQNDQVKEKHENVSLSTLFWLAYGFLVQPQTVTGTMRRQAMTIYSLEDPVGWNDERQFKSTSAAYCQLVRSSDMPLMVHSARTTLGLCDTQSWQMLIIKDLERRSPTPSGVPFGHPSRWRTITLHASNKGSFRRYRRGNSNHKQQLSHHYLKEDIVSMGLSYFSLDLDSWGLLRWTNGKFWDILLDESVPPAFRDGFHVDNVMGMAVVWSFISGRTGLDFPIVELMRLAGDGWHETKPEDMRNLRLFESSLSSILENSPIGPWRHAIATLSFVEPVFVDLLGQVWLDLLDPDREREKDQWEEEDEEQFREVLGRRSDGGSSRRGRDDAEDDESFDDDADDDDADDNDADDNDADDNDDEVNDVEDSPAERKSRYHYLYHNPRDQHHIPQKQVGGAGGLHEDVLSVVDDEARAVALLAQSPFVYKWRANRLTWTADNSVVQPAVVTDDDEEDNQAGSVRICGPLEWEVRTTLDAKNSGQQWPEEIRVTHADMCFLMYWIAFRALIWEEPSLNSKPLVSFIEKLDSHVYVL